MYEVVWLKMFSTVMGVTIYAAGTVIAAFMAGLALGSYLFGKLVDRRSDALRLYAILELCVAAAALLVPALIEIIPPILSSVFSVTGDTGFGLTVLRTVLSFLILLLPTTMMGGTLPILTSHLINREKDFGKNFSLLYGLNTGGAVVGVLLAGFVTLSAFGLSVTTYMAAAINVCVSVIAFVLYRLLPSASGVSPVRGELEIPPDRVSPYSRPVRRIVLIVLGLSGLTSMAYEVIWTRQLMLFMRTSTYAFSFMLAVFLTGVTWGSIYMSGRVNRLKKPIFVLALFEMLVGFLALVNLYLFIPLDSETATIMFGLSSKFLAVILIVLPITFGFGALMPVAAVSYTRSLSQSGSSVGRLYSTNTIGGIAGSLLAGFFMIPVLGSTYAVAALAILNFVLAGILFYHETATEKPIRLLLGLVVPVVLLAALFPLNFNPFQITTIQRMTRFSPQAKLHYYKECVEGSVTAFSIGTGYKKVLWINSEGMTKLCTETKLMAHFPLMAVAEPKEMLVVCFGMGSTVKSAASYPGLKVTAVELVKELYDLFSYYQPDKPDLLTSPNITPIVGDGRNFLLLSKKKYDVITIDPAPPIWSAGSDNLYSKEFLTLCRDRINPGGAMLTWFPIGTALEVKSVLKTVLSVFPYATVFRGPHGWGYYIIGQESPFDWEKFEKSVAARLDNPDIHSDLAEYDQVAATAEQIMALKLWDTAEAVDFSRDGRIITDDRPLLQLPLWRYLLNNPPFLGVKGGPGRYFMLQ